MTAVAPDLERSALVVPAINFSLLVTRATPFEPFKEVLFQGYTDPVERALGLDDPRCSGTAASRTATPGT